MEEKMSKKTTKRKPQTPEANPERIYILDDFTPYLDAVNEGRLTAAEAEAIFGESRFNGLMNGEDTEDYLRDFGKPAFFVGASNSGVIMQLSPFMHRYFLQLEKTRQMIKAVTPATQWVFTIGHAAERFVGDMGCRMLADKGIDVRYEDCPYGYVNSRWPHVLIHPDGFLLNKDGKLAYLAEVKTASEMSPHWINDFMREKVPADYDCQVQVEMRVLSAIVDIDECYVLVWNKTGDEEGFKQILVKHDRKRAEEILDEMEKFYEDTVSGIYYDDEELFPDEAAAIFKEEDKSLGYVDLPKKHEKAFEQLASLVEERDALKAEIAEAEADIREIDRNIRLIKSRFYGSIGKAPGGVFQRGDDLYRVEVRRSYSLDKDVKREIADRWPDVWEEIKTIKPRISSRLVKISGDTVEEFCDDDDEF